MGSHETRTRERASSMADRGSKEPLLRTPAASLLQLLNAARPRTLKANYEATAFKKHTTLSACLPSTLPTTPHSAVRDSCPCGG